MTDLTLVKELGLQVALAVYLLWQQRRFMDGLAKKQEALERRLIQLEDERRRDAKQHAVDFRELVERMLEDKRQWMDVLKSLKRLMQEHFLPNAHNGDDSGSGLVPAVRLEDMPTKQHRFRTPRTA